MYYIFNNEQVKQLLKWYVDGAMSKNDVLAQLQIKDSRFYELLSKYKSNPKQFSVVFSRDYANHRLPSKVIAAIHRELDAEKSFILNPNMPIMFYNYATIRDIVAEKTNHDLSATTVINYAKKWGYYIERPKKKTHQREVITDSVGMLLQHDASLHQWTPYAQIDPKTNRPVKWSLITTLYDHSRKILYAELFEHESAWAHIQALESVVLNYGVGVQYYADNHSIFRYVADRDQQIHINRMLSTDDIAPQWKQCLEAAGMKVIYAMSPEAKGKIERPYRWLQDRIVRRSAREHALTIESVRRILYHEVDRYNNRQVHSTTKEIPSKRFNNAVNDGRSCFRPLDLTRLNPPISSTKDIFCLRAERRIDGYGQVSLFGRIIKVPGNLPEGTAIILHIVPSEQTTEVRMLRDNIVLGYTQISTSQQLRF